MTSADIFISTYVAPNTGQVKLRLLDKGEEKKGSKKQASISVHVCVCVIISIFRNIMTSKCNLDSKNICEWTHAELKQNWKEQKSEEERRKK